MRKKGDWEGDYWKDTLNGVTLTTVIRPEDKIGKKGKTCFFKNDYKH